jgi:3-phosphoshikimate 1-carboxyvinyltransferase
VSHSPNVSQFGPSPAPGSREWHAQVATLSRAVEELPDPLPIPIIGRAFNTGVRPPGSKSLTNRVLLIAGLATGESVLEGALVDADDAQVMLRALRQLGAEITIEAGKGEGGSSVRVRGVGGQWRVGHAAVELMLNNAGTATRFLAAAAVLAPRGSGGVLLDGSARMRERPIRELGDAMARLGANVRYMQREGYPPLKVGPPSDGRVLASSVEFGATASSQFISAMVMIAPMLEGGLCVTSRETLTSPSYVAMTVGLMQRLGVRFTETEPREGETLRVSASHQPLNAFTLAIEPDASGATYFEAAAALVPGARCVVRGLDVAPVAGKSSLQGDTRFVSVIAAAGGRVERTRDGLCITGGSKILPIDIDLGDMPDTAMTAAALACFAEPTEANPHATSVLHGLRTLRVKETDRLAALQRELSKIGAKVEIATETWHGVPDEALHITPRPIALDAETIAPVMFDTYDDHRMAMALSLVGLRRPGVLIRDPACVRKTYPNYFQDLANLYI